jgi:uncharacterized SAM-binding protein YcdF (DUF218 family)
VPPEPTAIVVLGCALRASRDSALIGASGRRTREAARVFHERAAGDPGLLVFATGGRAWAGVAEADGMAAELERLGVPSAQIVRETLSLSTRDNARNTAAQLRRRGIGRAVVVTCAWHLPRATALFRRHGLAVEGVPAEDPGASLAQRVYRWGRERVAARLDEVRS